MEEMKKRRVRNTFDRNSGLPVMVNLLIIRTLYYGMKHKAECFEIESTGHKKKYVPVYDNSILNISRSRYDRLQRGAPFEISNREANELAALFQIDIRYFRRDTPDFLPLADLTPLDWQCFYNKFYDVYYDFSGKVSEPNIAVRAEKVMTELQKLVNKEWNPIEDDKNPVFYIWYYFRNGKTYEKINPVVKCMEELQQVEPEDWDRLYISTELEQYRDTLRKQYDYVNALVTIKNLRK